MKLLKRIKSKYIQLKDRILRYFDECDTDIDRYIRERNAMNHHYFGVAAMNGYFC